MKDSIEHGPSGVKLQITFPKSKEDHRLQLVKINNAIFAIVHSPLESLGPIQLHCEEWSLILLAPIKSQSDIFISATNVICLNEIASEEGSVSVHASNRLVKFAPVSKHSEKVTERGERGEFQLEDDPATLLYCYRVFTIILEEIRSKNPELISKAQQQMISALCTLADKMKGNVKDLNLHAVLQIWAIS